MSERTWPYGTQIPVEVVGHRKAKHSSVLVVTDAEYEGYILVGTPGQYDHLEPGARGIITFTKGGPTGGYFAFSRTCP